MTTLLSDELEEHCKKIMLQRRLKGVIVVLCEGRMSNIRARTVQQYRQLDHIPDANFYLNAVPRSWRTKRPQFVPSGGRSEVIKVFKRLQELHQTPNPDSFLEKEKIFALVDLDLQKEPLFETCLPHETSEDLFAALYQEKNSSAWSISSSIRILCTGWVHKELYFFEPDLEDADLFFTEEAMHDGSPLQFEALYQQMIHDLQECPDLRTNFDTGWQRIAENFRESASSPEELTDFFEKWWTRTESNIEERRKLINAMFQVKKAKSYWKALEPNTYEDPSSRDIQQAKEQWTLEIAKFYANSYTRETNGNEHRYHIHQWMHFLLAHHEGIESSG